MQDILYVLIFLFLDIKFQKQNKIKKIIGYGSDFQMTKLLTLKFKFIHIFKKSRNPARQPRSVRFTIIARPYLSSKKTA